MLNRSARQISQTRSRRAAISRASLVERQSRSRKKNRRRSKNGSEIGNAPKKNQISFVVLRTFGILGTAAASVFALYVAHRYAMESDMFSIRAIEVENAARADRQTILSLAQVSQDENLLKIDSKEVRANVERHPWIKNAKVTKRWPSRLVIDVEEHQPSVLVALGHLYYADETGAIVKRRSPYESEFLPTITGIDRARIESGDAKAQNEIREAVRFLRDLEAVQKEDAPKVAELHYDAARDLSVVFAGEPARVRVGKAPWKKKIEQLSEVKKVLDAQRLSATEINLGGERRPDRVVARLSSKVED